MSSADVYGPPTSRVVATRWLFGLASLALSACSPTPELEGLWADHTWLFTTHSCQLAMEALASGADAEALVGLSAAAVFPSRPFQILVELDDPALTPPDPWVFQVPSPWELYAFRTFFPYASCPTGLTLEAWGVSTLTDDAGPHTGESFFVVSEGEPSFIFWEFTSTFPPDEATPAWQAAIERLRPAGQAVDVRLELSQFGPENYVTLAFHDQGNLGGGYVELARGSFVVLEGEE